MKIRGSRDMYEKAVTTDSAHFQRNVKALEGIIMDEKLPILSAVEEDILSVLYPNKEVYGLEIIKTIEKASNGLRKIGPNSLYPTLRRMESSEKRYINSRWGDEKPEELEERAGARRRYYKLTEHGKQVLEALWKYRNKLAPDYRIKLEPAIQ
ncbi:MAG: PadR family transcriptional regulator [Scytonematopsis contorta HA4267-MV1]|jgi:PadR family transcriptional regulator, regulatory protein PadR|nr:PadR family transcriptional regulator [Scytonematopsis contorta HA4267-MV1]